MLNSRLKRYVSEKSRFRVPLEGTYSPHITIITIIQDEYEQIWSNEIFNYIVASLKEISLVEKIIIDFPQKDLIRVWTVIKKEAEKTSKLIYEKEIEIIGYITNFDYDIDFHLVTFDMMDSIIDKKSKVIFSR